MPYALRVKAARTRGMHLTYDTVVTDRETAHKVLDVLLDQLDNTDPHVDFGADSTPVRDYDDPDDIFDTSDAEPVDRDPYVGEGADGCRRSAEIDRSEADGLPRGDDRDARLRSADQWDWQAERIEAAGG